MQAIVQRVNQTLKAWKEQRVACPQCGLVKYQAVKDPIARCACGHSWDWKRRMKLQGGR